VNNFLKNAWYVAAWSDEVKKGELFNRTLLDIPVVIYRNTDGKVVAMEDRCPHRFAPLHCGKLIGNYVECPYHGLQFGEGGKCVHNPHGDGKIPLAARVRAFAVEECDGIVWIWMGDPGNANPAAIVRYPEIVDNTTLRTIHGHFVVKCDYRVEMDNLMDLTHPEFLHADSIGSGGLKAAKYEVKQVGETTVHSNRWFDKGLPPPLFDQIYKLNGQQVEHWANMRWDAPSNLYLDVGVTLVGRSREDGNRAVALHLLTPGSETSTHYFFSHTRDHDLDSDSVDEMIRNALIQVFVGEDKPMVEAVQQRMGTTDLWSLKPVLLSGDAGAVRARRALEKLISDELARSEG